MIRQSVERLLHLALCSVFFISLRLDNDSSWFMKFNGTLLTSKLLGIDLKKKKCLNFHEIICGFFKLHLIGFYSSCTYALTWNSILVCCNTNQSWSHFLCNLLITGHIKWHHFDDLSDVMRTEKIEDSFLQFHFD